MLRIVKDRYRPVFCTDAFYLQNQKLFSEWNQLFNKLNSTEKALAWVIALSLLRRPEDWFGGLRKHPFVKLNETSKQHPLILNDLQTTNSSLQIPHKLKGFNLFQVANEVKIKAVPDSALRSLACMTDQIYPLQILKYVPSPAELLQFQLEDKRIISFNEDFESWSTTLYHGRDFLSFMIHDLIHADHFFSNSANRSGQLGFYQCVKLILQDESLKNLLENPSFNDGFEYIISDMNSHPIHLFKTLHARIVHVSENEMKANFVWRHWTSVWSQGNFDIDSALQKINTQLFSDTDALKITEWCIALGHNSRLGTAPATEV
jgi:hypothetical protein